MAPTIPSQPPPISYPGEIGPPQSFKYRDFRILRIGNAFAMAANWVQQTTLGCVVFELTGSGSILGAANGVRSVSMSFLSPLGGVAADIFGIRNMVVFMTCTGTPLTVIFLFGAPSIRRLTLLEMTATKNPVTSA